MAEVTQPVADALEVLGLDLPVSQEQLEHKRKELLHIWDPSRYANLTNNPKKYMQMYKEAEEMTKKIEAAYVTSLFLARLSSPILRRPNHHLVLTAAPAAETSMSTESYSQHDVAG